MTPRGIDTLVAEKVMGWKERTPNHWLAPEYPDNHQFTVHSDEIPPFSTDIAEAWLIQNKYPFTLCPYPNGRWHASNGRTIAFADSAPMALCLAALKEVGVEL